MVPGRTGSPSAASRTRRRQRLSSRSAKSPVNSSGICCTMSTGSGKLAGSAGSRISSAAGPPVETPMARTAGADEMDWGRLAGGMAARRERGGRWEAAAGTREGAGQGMNPGNQIAGERAGGALAAHLFGRLGHIVRSAAGQGLDGHLRAALRKRTAHDHRHLVSSRAQLPQRHQSVHHRHLHIQQNQVGTKHIDALKADCAVRRGPGHLQARIGADHRAQQAPHHCRVVHNQNPGPAAGAIAQASTSPSMASFSSRPRRRKASSGIRRRPHPGRAE